MMQLDEMTKAYRDAMSPEIAGAVNLLAHPVAGAAAAGAIGVGLASHAFGMWLGAMVGAAEASQKMLAAAVEAEAPRPAARTRAPRLSLVPPAAGSAAVKPKGRAESPAEAAPSAMVPARPAGIDRPGAPDDLKAIGGIGPKLEKLLNGYGIWTWRQIAALTGPEIAWLDRELGFAGRIGRDDWTGQARALAARA